MVNCASSGNYDEYMTAASQARDRLLADNAKKKAQIAELQTFVARFSANASKAKQATSRAKQIDKIKLDEVKASSRQNPFIRFEQTKELFRNALELENLSQGFDSALFAPFSGILKWVSAWQLSGKMVLENQPCSIPSPACLHQKRVLLNGRKMRILVTMHKITPLNLKKT